MSALCSELLHLNDKTNKEEESHPLSIVALQRHHEHIQEKSHGRYE